MQNTPSGVVPSLRAADEDAGKNTRKQVLGRVQQHPGGAFEWTAHLDIGTTARTHQREGLILLPLRLWNEVNDKALTHITHILSKRTV